MSTILCIDTASDHFALAVDRDGLVSSVEAEANQDHSRLLLPAIQDLLRGEQPAGILVVLGPGAYAGIRVGIATAEGFALALGVPVFGIGTLEAAALASGVSSGWIVHPAGRGEFAVQKWQDGQPASDIRIAAPQTIALPAAGEGATALDGLEIGARQRAEAALRARAASIRSGALTPGAEAFYLREPSITVSRRKPHATVSPG